MTILLSYSVHNRASLFGSSAKYDFLKIMYVGSQPYEVTSEDGLVVGTTYGTFIAFILSGVKIGQVKVVAAGTVVIIEFFPTQSSAMC